MSTFDIPNGYLSEPPAGQVRTLIDPPTQQASILAVALSTTVIAAVAVGIRFYTRVRVVGGRISIDDAFVLTSLLLTVISIVVNYQQIQHGLSYHKWDISYETYNVGYPAFAIAGTCTYALSVGFAKLSILLFYLRLSPQTWFRAMVYGLIGAISCYSLIYVFLNIFPCQPVAAAWDLNVEQSKCIDAWKAYYALSILNIFMDVATLVLPVPVVLGLNISTRQKVSLVLLFATGILVCAIAIRRTILIPSLISTKDRTWDVSMDYIFSYLEVNAGIICASVPALKPFFLQSLPSMVTSPKSSNERRNTPQRSFGHTSFGLTTAAEQNRHRRMMQQSRSYELSSLDNGRHFEKGSEDEDAKLWSPGRSDGGVKVATRLNDTEISSLDTLEDSTVPIGVNESIVSSSAGPGYLIQGAIQVQKETRVHYDAA